MSGFLKVTWYFLEEHPQQPEQCAAVKRQMMLYLESKETDVKVDQTHVHFISTMCLSFTQVAGIRIGRRVGKLTGLPYWGKKRGLKGDDSV